MVCPALDLDGVQQLGPSFLRLLVDAVEIPAGTLGFQTFLRVFEAVGGGRFHQHLLAFRSGEVEIHTGVRSGFSLAIGRYLVVAQKTVPADLARRNSP